MNNRHALRDRAESRREALRPFRNLNLDTNVRVEHSTSYDQDEPRSHFERLPPELRNNILQLTLIKNKPIDVSTAWPPILATCTQLRNEGLPVYLGNNNFVARIKDHNTEYLIRWLGVVKALPEGMKRLIRSLTFIFSGRIFDKQSYRVWHSRGPYAANIDFWDTMILRIKDSGLKAKQLVWAGIGHMVLMNSIKRSRRHEILRIWLLNTFVLLPLLDQRSMLDTERPPVNVMAQMGKYWSDAKAKPEYRFAVWGIENEAEYNVWREGTWWDGFKRLFPGADPKKYGRMGGLPPVPADPESATTFAPLLRNLGNYG